MWLKKFITIFLLLAFDILPLSSGEFEPAYLKICGKHKKHRHAINSLMCHKGIWLKKPIDPGCICIRGVWALSNGFCDEKAVILVGDGHCFQVAFKIRSAKLIGDPSDPFKPTVYSAPSSLDSIYELNETGYSPGLRSDNTLIIAINPRQVAQRIDFGVCLDLPPEEWDKPVHIYENPRRSPTEWTLNPKGIFKCPVTTSYRYFVGFGDMYLKNRVDPKLMVERDCIQDCPQEEQSRPMGRSLMTSSHDSSKSTSPSFRPRTASTSNTTYLPDKPIYLDSKSIIYNRPPKTQEEITLEKVEARALVEEDEDIFKLETNEQTLRMMHSHVSPLLLNVSVAQIRTKEYQYFQLMRQLVERACPDDFVPRPFLRGLMRMFRQLLWESQESFSHAESSDEEQHKRSMEILSYCLNMTHDPAILFTSLHDSYSNSTRDPSKLYKIWPDHASLPPERCPNPFVFSVNATDYNRTHYHIEHIYLKNISQYWPNLKYNLTHMDYVIETAWKIVLMGQYRCSKYFNSSSYSDYSNIFHRMESFFNRKILKRWYYEPSVNSTYNVVNMIFPSYDLKKFAFGMDTCLLGIQKFSKFDYQLWLHRPKFPGTTEDFSPKVYRAKGKDYKDNVLSTFDYAPLPAWPNPFFETDKKKYPTPLPLTHGRRKRMASSYPFKIKYNLWNNQARCIRDYLEPLKIPGAYQYNVPPGCISPTGLAN